MKNKILEFLESNCDIKHCELGSNKRGYYDRIHDKIVINSNLEGIDLVYTLLHEYVHFILHKKDKYEWQNEEFQASNITKNVLYEFGMYNGVLVKDVNKHTIGISNVDRDLDIIEKTSLKIIANIKGSELNGETKENTDISPLSS